MNRSISRSRLLVIAPVLVTLAVSALGSGVSATAGALASVNPGQSAQIGVSSSAGSNSLEAAASKAGDTGRKVAMSLITLAFAIASIALAFRRDFKEAAGVFVIGIFAVLLATPTGLNLLQDTVNTLFGS